MIRATIKIEVESPDHLATLLALGVNCAKSQNADIQLSASEAKVGDGLKLLRSRRLGPKKCPRSMFECVTEVIVEPQAENPGAAKNPVPKA